MDPPFYIYSLYYIQLEPQLFHKIFTEAMGVTPNEFVTKTRLDKVKDLLVRTDISVAEIAVLHFLISKLNLYKWFNHIITGEPTILIKHGKLIPINLKRSRYSLMELLSTIRAAGIPDIEDIEYAILEPNGEITILPQVDLVPVTPRLLKIDTEYKGLPIAVILEGKIQHKNSL
ncbi:YetF domain-containing protein [Neobacillus niacini]|uniref:YetF domain-containing protein n=1 Tax=Neobacillus niacini TaxID=86668 RepID=UPI000693D886|nr:YetF domain-containing protein [Neobacillus niacini]